MPYCTNTNVKDYGNVTSSDDDTLLTTLIARAQQIIDSRCDQTFEASADTTRYFDAILDVSEGKRILYLDAPLCQITSITNGDGLTVASSKYVTEPRNRTPWHEIRLKFNSDVVWTFDETPEDAISVVGRWAYSITPPADIVHACIRLTWWLYKQRDTANDLDRPQMSPSGVMIMPIRLPKDVEALLYPRYVRH